ncbi:MAG: BCCT family transporter, partial [Halomonas sp.]
ATIFEMYNSMPHPAILSTATLLLLFFFLVTSVDSATYVVSQISDNGSQSPAIYKRITWGILISITCWILLSFGGLHGLQSASIIAALPLTLIILLMIRNFIKKLKEDY